MKKTAFSLLVITGLFTACDSQHVDKNDPLPNNQQTIQSQDTTSQYPDKTENPVYNDTTGVGEGGE